MNFALFLEKLEELEKTIAITSPVNSRVRAVYTGAPGETLTTLPCVINTFSETQRDVGFGGRDETLLVNIQLMATRSPNVNASMAAAALWFAAKDVFDADRTIGGTVAVSTLRSSDPGFPVLLTHGGATYIGFSAVLEVRVAEELTF